MSVEITVRVVPRASKSEVVGLTNGILKIRLTSPPVDGAANTELIRLLAKTFSVAKRDVTIVSGQTSRNKRIAIDNLSQSKFDEVTR
ncbi:MAG TPA: DUF167 domain-containing protein [Pyrinomonadaceae bacterium]|nr:DUF167 domain-containing protein [Pyrinomonadaceae bacterium]